MRKKKLYFLDVLFHYSYFAAGEDGVEEGGSMIRNSLKHLWLSMLMAMDLYAMNRKMASTTTLKSALRISKEAMKETLRVLARKRDITMMGSFLMQKTR